MRSERAIRIEVSAQLVFAALAPDRLFVVGQRSPARSSWTPPTTGVAARATSGQLAPPCSARRPGRVGGALATLDGVCCPR